MDGLRRVRRPAWVAVPIVAAVLATAPIAALASSVLRPNREVWRQQWDTRLPDQITTTIALTAGVVTCSVALGIGLAWLVGAHRFPGRRFLSWALVLPLAMPGYILGFVATATFGVAGPLQSSWRDAFGRDAWFPEVRSLPGAIITLTLTLYPYVYLLARAALRDQAATAFQVARTLGASRAEAARRVVVPMLRPAIAAGAAIVAMETLTDFATVQYFNQETVTVGVFRIWRGTYDRDAASEIATLVLVFALFAIALERILRGRARFGESAGQGGTMEPERLRGWRAAGATVGAASVVTIAFVAPTLRLLTWAITEQRSPRGTPMVERYVEFLRHSLTLVAVTVAICLVVSTVVANAHRFTSARVVRYASRISIVGYAVPGPVVAMGVVLTLVAVDDALDAGGASLPGFVATGSFVALAYAYAIRFLAPGLTSVEAGMSQVHTDMTASAQALGASPLAVVRRIHLPLSRTSMLAAAVLVGVDALKELPIAYLLRPVGFDTLPIWVFDLASESRFAQAALPALTIILVALAPVALMSRRLDRSLASARPVP
ncbi:MAG: ABC transporter permease [Acidimicrobiales bacterium]